MDKYVPIPVSQHYGHDDLGTILTAQKLVNPYGTVQILDHGTWEGEENVRSKD